MTKKNVHLNVLLLILAHLDSDEQEQGSSNKEMQGELYNNHYNYLILTDLFENRTILCFLVVILLIQVIVAIRIYQSPHISYWHLFITGPGAPKKGNDFYIYKNFQVVVSNIQKKRLEVLII